MDPSQSGDGLPPVAEVLLLIIAANGGEMDQADAHREWQRVMALSPDERAEWRQRILPLAQHYARQHFGRK